MTELVDYINNLIGDIKLEAGEEFYWSPKKRLITYKPELLNEPSGQWALIHEAAHALQNHSSYNSDIGLLKIEVEAWDKAKEIARPLNITIDEDHIQDCLDTYRDWLYGRSTCPTCEIVCLQSSSNSYKCHNCHTTWSVSSSRFCRPYRLTIKERKRKQAPVV